MFGNMKVLHAQNLEPRTLELRTRMVRFPALCSLLLPPCYVTTFSARIRTTGGIVRPRDLAVLELITSSNFVGCSTGRSAGLVPFRILSTYRAASRPTAAKLGP